MRNQLCISRAFRSLYLASAIFTSGGLANAHPLQAAQDAGGPIDWSQFTVVKPANAQHDSLLAKTVQGKSSSMKKLEFEEYCAALANMADAGDEDARSFLRFIYGLDDNVPKVTGADLFQKGAALGNAYAQYHLARMFSTGKGMPRNPAKAAEWFQKAAVQGHASQFNLGVKYAKGVGVTKNARTAFEWFERAAAQGVTNAQLNLAVMFSTGDGTPKNAVKAADWFTTAAAQGNATAQYQLGRALFIGDGVSKDFVLSYAWANLAASSEDMREDARKARRGLEQRMTKAELAEAQRLSAAWKIGQVLFREGLPSSTVQSDSNATLSKKGTGTIFLVSKTGHAITNYHVVEGCTELHIQGSDGLIKLVTKDTTNDLALLQIKSTGNDAATIVAEPGKVRQGDDILAFGFPLNTLLSSGGNLTPGIVSALSGLGNNTNQIQITAPIQPGSSGSPVLNKRGEVVGVVAMKLSDTKMAKATGSVGQNVSFAISGQTLKTFLDIHKVSYSTGGGFFAREKSAADLADEARKWTQVVECWK